MQERAAHSFTLSGRKQLVMEGVQQVGSFDESEIALETNMGTLILKGEGLHITMLNLDTGTLSAEGFFNAAIYTESKKGKGKGILSRILK
ncbi:MAG: sporulation protein YabP [Eubacteriales bacterium]